MPLDEGYVGRTYPPTEPYEVGREKIREFAEAIGETNGIYTDPEVARAHGYRDVVAPPTFVFSLSYRAAHQVTHDPQLGLDYNRVVHGDQGFSYVRPVLAGDWLSVTSTIESVRTMAGNDILVVRGDVHDKGGELVVTARTMLVARGADGK
ncbi:MaoC family dehydratase N-terminal domain-containing protein [Streptomyces sp. 796.1]|uniref:FAS1-like dehydratase domain-containing protein n=1 Tax=Streptomyces sp. 796.1 TaxID=3163029 RepID=UPI0039C9641C